MGSEMCIRDRIQTARHCAYKSCYEFDYGAVLGSLRYFAFNRNQYTFSRYAVALFKFVHRFVQIQPDKIYSPNGFIYGYIRCIMRDLRSDLQQIYRF